MFAFLMIVLLLALWANSTTVTATDWLSVCVNRGSSSSTNIMAWSPTVSGSAMVEATTDWLRCCSPPWTYWYSSCLIRLSAVCQQQNNRQQFVIIVSIAIHWANLFLLIWVKNVSWNVCKLKFYYGRHVSFDSSFQRISSSFLNFLFKVGRRTFPPK